MDDMNALRPHTLTLENRKKISLNGITDVGSFNEESLFVMTEHGELSIRGNDIQITRLDLDIGEMTAEGVFDTFSYSDLRKKEKKSFFKGL